MADKVSIIEIKEVSFHPSKLLILISLLLLVSPLQAQDETIEPPRKKVVIGLIHDGREGYYKSSIDLLRKELDLILGSSYDISIPNGKVFAVEDKTQLIEESYRELTEDPEVDYIVCLGVLSGAILLNKGDFPKPLIIYGIEDPVIQGVSMERRETSGIHNLSYILTSESFANDLAVFLELYRFKKLGILLDQELIELLPLKSEQLDSLMAKRGFEIEVIPVMDQEDSIIVSIPEDVDAVFLGYFTDYVEEENLKKLLEEVNQKGLPSFTSSVEIVEMGALATNTPAPDFAKAIRRIVLNIESILNDIDPADLPVILESRQKLTVNVATLNKLKLSPSYGLLSNADLLNQFEIESNRRLDLLDVLIEVQRSNIDLRARYKEVESFRQNRKIARSFLFPFGIFNLFNVIVDEQQSELGGMTQVQFASVAVLSFFQVIFDEQLMGEVRVQKLLADAVAFDYEAFRLDNIQFAATAYFDILRARNLLSIAQDNLRFTKENLEVARAREEVGYADISDVYRWEANEAQQTAQVIGAKNIYDLTQISLNILLNRPYTEPFIIRESLLSDSIFSRYFDERMVDLLYSPNEIQNLTDFLILEGIRNSPEIKAIDARIASQIRFKKLVQRERYIPDFLLNVAFFYSLFTGGGQDPIVVPGTIVDPLLPPRLTTEVNVTLFFPFLQGGRVKNVTQQAVIDLLQLEEQRRSIILQIERNVSQAVLFSSVNAFELDLFKKAAEYSRKAFVIVRESYSGGRSTFVDLLQAQNEAILASLQAANAVYQFLNSLIDIDRAISSFAMLRSPEEEEDMAFRFREYFPAYKNK
ncbi:TolC family protein [Xanthovirga aplysinae]|uniref:TolC family protein n=1 Tax=Xanthovirga aplysinae TaxID=2529853 RepID=UPI0012BC82A5|nr:TolC family protein [Xanthovirga aplysinae]MTI32475.1 hypothetical protein [Xanthovirga aplysinae]